MIILIGAIIVLACVIGGFIMTGGHVAALFHPSELIIIGGACTGALIIMSPGKVLADLWKGLLKSFKGEPHDRHAYDELLQAMYELFLLGRRNGLVALEEHLTNPASSDIFTRYPTVLAHPAALEFLCGALRPVVDGRVKPEQLKMLLDTELRTTEAEHHAPGGVLTRAADSLPGFGIVAAVLGIVVTMAGINGPISEIGHKVAAALVGTFLGILLCYGFVNPLAVKLEFLSASEMLYLRCIAAAVNGFVTGLEPVMAVEVARRSLTSNLRPSESEIEAMLKAVNAQRRTA